MTLGEKIKLERKKKKMTQAELCGNKITRNMLSEIENNKAMPSIETLTHIASGLSIPLPYLLSEEDDSFFYSKKHEMRYITAAFKSEKYLACIEHINKIEGLDDELAYILACSYFELGRTALLHGSLRSADKYLNLARDFCEKTIYNTQHIKSRLPLYLAITANIQSPLLELTGKPVGEDDGFRFEIEFYHYISNDFAYEYKMPDFARHIEAKKFIRERDYFTAVKLMKEIEIQRTSETYNACVIFGIYTDMETCYKQLGDFENAYRYASKRISMIEGFKS